MTIEKRFSGTLNDILEVILICKKCGARMGYNPGKWKEVPVACANCRGSVGSLGIMLPNSLEYVCLESFKGALQSAIAASNSLPFEIRLEFQEPVSK
jgi:hypothetical protein